jgi:tetratricopeptide (TPR) repeat protein
MRTRLPVSAVSSVVREHRRLIILGLAGLIAIALGIGLRRSGWARERYLQALPVNELALAIHDQPDDPLVFLYYGSSLLKAGNAAGAEQAFRHAIQLDPRLSRAHVGLGSALLRQGNPAAAVEALQEGVRLAPNDPAAHLGLAQAYYLAGSPRRAIPSLETITRLEPKQAAAWYWLGKIYGDSSQSDEAMRAMERATRLEPDQAMYWRDLGQLKRHYSRLAEAQQHLERAAALDPADATTHYWLGQLYAQQGDTSELRARAEKELQEALRLDPKLSEAHFELGQVYERRREWARAAASYRTAQQLDPSHARPLYHLGLCLIKLGKPAEGKQLIRAFDELLAAKRELEGLDDRAKAEPRNPDLQLRLARAYRKYGNDEGALLHYQMYLDLSPNDAAVERESIAYRAAVRPSAGRGGGARGRAGSSP